MYLKKNAAFLILGAFLLLTSCEEYNQFGNMEVVEDSYSGTMSIGSIGQDPGGDFIGNGDSGTYSFAWENPSTKANVNFDITTSSGSVQMIINDSRGNEVLNETRNAGGDDTFTGITQEGKAGTWLVTIILTDFNGDGSFSISPGV